TVKLLEGQALFRVAKDPSRPFIVDTDSVQFRAVGTAFDVSRHGTEATVTVLEGTVAVLTTTVPEPKVLVNAGQQAVVNPQARPHPRPANVAAAAAWTRGQLEFDETPLAQVADEFNRSSTRPLVLASPTVRSVRISGVYSSIDPGALILFLKSQPDLEV